MYFISDNFAYLKQASQKQAWESHSAGHPVDGNATTCTVVQPPVDDPWWMVDIGKNVIIQGFRILFSTQTYGVFIAKFFRSQHYHTLFWFTTQKVKAFKPLSCSFFVNEM